MSEPGSAHQWVIKVNMYSDRLLSRWLSDAKTSQCINSLPSGLPAQSYCAPDLRLSLLLHPRDEALMLNFECTAGIRGRV